MVGYYNFSERAYHFLRVSVDNFNIIERSKKWVWQLAFYSNEDRTYRNFHHNNIVTLCVLNNAVTLLVVWCSPTSLRKNTHLWCLIFPAVRRDYAVQLLPGSCVGCTCPTSLLEVITWNRSCWKLVNWCGPLSLSYN